MTLQAAFAVDPSGEQCSPDVRSSLTPLAYPAATAVLILGAAAGAAPDGPEATMAACAAILVLGLPHGAFDLAALLRVPRRARALGLYLLLAAGMGLIWLAAPVVALALFLVVAIAHFGEDWAATGSPPIAQGTALAMLCAPMIWHGREIDALFVAITGAAAANTVAAVLILVGPVAGAAALVAILTMWRSRHQAAVVALGSVIVGMAILPPVIGFALFFCLFHSPRHFRSAWQEHRLRSGATWVMPVVIGTLGGLAIAVALERVAVPLPDARWVRATFVALSMLTVPHMLMPLITRAAGARSGRQQG